MNIVPSLWTPDVNDSNVNIYDFSRTDRISNISGFANSYDVLGFQSYTLTAPATNRRPRILSNFLNGKSVLEFGLASDGNVNDCLVLADQTSTLGGSADFSIFVLCRTRDTSATKNIIMKRNSTATNTINYQLRYDGSENLSNITRSSGGQANHTHNQTGTTPLTWQIIYFSKSGNTYSSSLNGGAVSTTTNSLIIGTTGEIRVGCGVDAFLDPFVGEIASIYVPHYATNTSRKEQYEGYIAHNWLLTSLLPSNHPFKNSPPLA